MFDAKVNKIIQENIERSIDELVDLIKTTVQKELHVNH